MAGSPDTDLDSRIRKRAFELWEQRDRPHGYSTEFWEQAKREIQGAGADDDGNVNADGARSGSGSDGPG